MDKSLIEKYKNELIKMYNTQNIKLQEGAEEYGENGKLIVNVTTLRQLYPVSNALVTVFSGNYENMTVIDSSQTDQNGKSKIFILPAPNKKLSLEAGALEPVYTSYGILVKADGYADEINLNLPIFTGVTSIQNVDMTLLSAGNGKNQNINDQAEDYNL